MIILKKIDFNIVKQYIEELGYELISTEYINAKEKLIIKDKDGYYYAISYDNLKQGNIPLLAHKSNPYSIQNIRLFIKNSNPNFVLLSDKYEGKDVHLTLKDKYGYYYSISFHNLKSHGINPLFVDTHNLYSIQNIKLFLKINNCNYTLLTDEYKNERTKLVLTDNYGYLYTKTWTALRRLNNFHIAIDDNPYSIQNIKLWCKLNNKPFELLSGEYKRNNKKLKWECLNDECGKIFEMSWSDISQGCGCQECSKSKGEKKTSEVLINNNYNKISQEEFNKLINKDKYNEYYYIPQMKYNGLIGLGKGLLSYDFYLPKYNLLIEYQGIQHEKYIPGFHKSIKDFEKQQEHDRRKKEYAQKHNINLLEIWYCDFDNIESILIKELDIQLQKVS